MAPDPAPPIPSWVTEEMVREDLEYWLPIYGLPFIYRNNWPIRWGATTWSAYSVDYWVYDRNYRSGPCWRILQRRWFASTASLGLLFDVFNHIQRLPFDRVILSVEAWSWEYATLAWERESYL